MKSLDRCKNKCFKTGRSFGFSAIRFCVAGLMLLSIALVAGGCGSCTGETVAERGLRHRRVFRVNNNQIMDDIDRILMLDKPHGLSKYRLP